jgi:phosphate uptake regulator
MTKTQAAITKLDIAAQAAALRLDEAAVRAQKMIDDACDIATASLKGASTPDRRNINGSYQWDLHERYRVGDLEVTVATNTERIRGIADDIKCIKQDIAALSDHVDALNKTAYLNSRLAKAAIGIVSAALVALIWTVVGWFHL